MQDTHYFNTKIAEELGIECAVLFQNISFWIEKNEANGKHLHDGRYWTYNSVKAFGKLFPYMTVGKIRRALKKLEEKDFLMVGNYNQIEYDRTSWYALTDNAKSILQKRQIHCSEMTNGSVGNDKPIPDSNPDEKKDSKPDNERESLDSVFESFWKVWPKKTGKAGARKWWNKHRPDATLCETMIRAVTAQSKSESWTKNNGQFIPLPQTWLNGERWEDDVSAMGGFNTPTPRNFDNGVHDGL